MYLVLSCVPETLLLCQWDRNETLRWNSQEQNMHLRTSAKLIHMVGKSLLTEIISFFLLVMFLKVFILITLKLQIACFETCKQIQFWDFPKNILFPSTNQYMFNIHANIYRPMFFIRHRSANCSQLSAISVIFTASISNSLSQTVSKSSSFGSLHF